LSRSLIFTENDLADDLSAALFANQCGNRADPTRRFDRDNPHEGLGFSASLINRSRQLTFSIAANGRNHNNYGHSNNQ
jgi:hypothetical protein